MSKRRVVITGLGTINPLGNNVSDSWEKLINGISGIDNICLLYTSPSPRDAHESRMPSSA